MNLRSMQTLVLMTSILAGSVAGCDSDAPQSVASGPPKFATIKTKKGQIRIQLHNDKVPNTCHNFETLAKSGFYDGLIFHNVQPEKAIQGGDRYGTGEGELGYTIPDEFHPGLKHDKPGVVSMANRGPNTSDSQFFITKAADPDLDRRFSIFGQVIEGQDVVNAIEIGDVMTVTIEEER